MIDMFQEHEFFYFNIIEESKLTDSITSPNFFKEYIYSGKDGFLRGYENNYKDIVGAVVKNFISKHQIDVFYITAPFLASSDIGYNIIYQEEWFSGICVVVTVYDIIPYVMKNVYLKSKHSLKWYMDCIEMIRWTDRHLVISQSVKDDMVNYLHFDSEKIDVIYGGVDEKYREIDISQTVRTNILNKFGIKSEFVMGCVSADQRKNTDGLIEAYALMRRDMILQYQLVIVGNVLPEKAEEYRKLIQKYGISDHVVIAGYVSDDEIVTLYNLAKLMIMPSLYEGFGLPVIESWACGTPVIASNTSSLTEIVNDVDMLFDPYNKSDMTKCMEKVLTETDLQEAVKKGKAKLRKYQWNRVAELSFNSIVRAHKEKFAGEIPTLACIFLQKQLFCDSWQKMIIALAKDYNITVLADTEQVSISAENDISLADISSLRKNYAQYDYILYISTDFLAADAYKIMHDFPGIWFVADKQADALMNTISGESSDISPSLATKLAFYFNPKGDFRKSADLYKVCTKIATVNMLSKRSFLKNGLSKPVYCINPQNAAVSKHSAENAAIVIKNISVAIKDPILITDGNRLINNINSEQIKPRGYSPQEIGYIAKTLGFAFSTDSSVRNLISDDLDSASSNRLRIDMVSTWNSKCGIAEYTKLYTAHVHGRIEFHYFPNIPDSRTQEDDGFVHKRTWIERGDMAELISELSKSNSKVIHIQYTEGFFTTQELARIVKKFCPEKQVVITCHNSKYLSRANGDERIILGSAHYVIHQSGDADNLLKIGIDTDNIHHIPHGQLRMPDIPKEHVRAMLDLAKHSPVIGSYGFLLPHKGVFETLQAVSVLKDEYPDIFYIACCAFYDAPVSNEYYDHCVAFIKNNNLTDNVKIITDFLKIEESLFLLQACDTFVMPYAKTEESASGAMRFCVAARRPLIVTRQKIFKEYEDLSLQIADNAPKNIVAGIRSVLDTENYERYLHKANEAADRNTWDYVGNAHVELYKQLMRSV
jgi:glycosyltransferase involved in cell wall biosynthesis